MIARAVLIVSSCVMAATCILAHAKVASAQCQIQKISTEKAIRLCFLAFGKTVAIDAA